MCRSFLVLVTSLALGLAGCGERRTQRSTPQRAPAENAVRMTMAALHAFGGVPPRWKFTPPPGDAAVGRQLFVDLGCNVCHLVADSGFPDPTGPGPALTGMGSHHPPGYFAEAIINPDAILVDGPGWIGEDGRSVMPTYPDLTIVEVADLVAYLQSLTSGSGHPPMQMPVASPDAVPREYPAPPDQVRTAFLAMSYAVRDGQLPALEEWFRSQGGPGFLAFPGLRSIETFYDRGRPATPYTTVFGFTDANTMDRFQTDGTVGRLGIDFDRFLGDHDHTPFAVVPPVYRVRSLSMP